MKCLIVLLSLVHLALCSKQFSFLDVKTNWHEAHQICTAQGMRLASVDSLAEHNAIVTKIEQSDKFNRDSSFWIGASDLAQEGRFTWIGSGLPLNFTKWADVEPNKYYPDENCAVLFFIDGDWSWNDLRCRSEAFVVCESVPKEHCHCREHFE